jgi:4-diphosphocytidyl-2-C-methyl-D-erythritol kinase
MCNDLETVTASLHPEIVSIKAQLVRYGALGALMSGSGPTVFGIFSDLKKAENARDALSNNVDWKLYLVDMIVKSGLSIEYT